MNARSALLMLGLSILGCSPSRAPGPPAPSTPAPAAASHPSKARTGKTIRYLRIEPSDLDQDVDVDLATAKTWAADPKNAQRVRPPFRHILVTTSKAGGDAAARKKIDALLARLVAGEDFAKLAKESDDPGSVNKGGSYPGETSRRFVAEVQAAYDGLAPGTFARQPVKSAFGWHIVAKGLVDDASALASYRSEKNLRSAEEIARRLHESLHHVAAGQLSEVVETAFTSVLGHVAENPPTIARLPADGSVPMSDHAECRSLAKNAREGTFGHASSGAVIVAALTDDPAEAEEVEGGECKATESHVAEPSVDTSNWVTTKPRESRLFEVLLVDDSVDVIGQHDERKIPDAIEPRTETPPIGPDKRARRSFLRLVARPKEPITAMLERGRQFLATVKHPKDAALVLERTQDEDRHVDGARSYVVRGPAIVDERDVVTANVVTKEGAPVVVVELGFEAKARLAEATRRWVGRRIALLVEGEVTAAPILRTELGGGRLEVWMPSETKPGAEKARAERFLKKLR